MRRRQAIKLLSTAAMVPTLRAFAFPAIPAPDDAFLDDMQRRAFLYFTEQAGAKSGQVLDRAAAANVTGKRDPRIMASVAATGFGLTALCIADYRHYAPRAALLDQVRRTLRFHLNAMPHDHGFLYHFNDVDIGAPFIGSEVSPIDTSLFLCGVLCARTHFRTDAETVDLATQLYNRVDWPWMLNGQQTFAMGFRSNRFINSRWSHYCELMMLNLLALGSPTHPVEPETWDAWTRPHMVYGGFNYIGANDPLFVHQYSHAYFDFRQKRDKYANYFTNSISATRAHKAFCLSLGKPYSEDYWGISASDSQHGYTAWGGPALADGRPPGSPGGPGTLGYQGPGFGSIDGSVVPNAAAGSLPFLPDDCLQVLRTLKAQYPQCWARYGFCDALHPAANWFAPDVLGIDLGIGLIMSENVRTGFVWETFGRNPEVADAMQKAGFR